MSQRPRWLPLLDELRLARVPYTRLRAGSAPTVVVHGAHTGEAIDYTYSVLWRRSVAFEVGGLICELREVVGRGPGLRRLIAMARATAEQLALVQPSRR